MTPHATGADLRAALVASCFRGALPPVETRAVCFVRAIVGLCLRFDLVLMKQQNVQIDEGG